jgi:Flp pilus assembly protein TadB
LTAAYIHDYLKATVLQAKSYKQYLKDTKSKSADGKKVEKLIEAMKKLVKKSKTKLNEAVKEEKAAAAAKKGSSTVIIIVVVVVALLVVVGVVVYCRRKKGGDDK